MLKLATLETITDIKILDYWISQPNIEHKIGDVCIFIPDDTVIDNTKEWFLHLEKIREYIPKKYMAFFIMD